MSWCLAKRVTVEYEVEGSEEDFWNLCVFCRGYYRCSSNKGCLARKQVERSCNDPSMLIVSYTAEHNHPQPSHRNLLAGFQFQYLMHSLWRRIFFPRAAWNSRHQCGFFGKNTADCNSAVLCRVAWSSYARIFIWIFCQGWRLFCRARGAAWFIIHDIICMWELPWGSIWWGCGGHYSCGSLQPLQLVRYQLSGEQSSNLIQIQNISSNTNFHLLLIDSQD